nr:hypothetical protein [Tanacetum cinerariifolium]
MMLNGCFYEKNLQLFVGSSFSARSPDKLWRKTVKTRVKVFSSVVKPINPTSIQKKPAAYKLPHAKIAAAKEAE